MSKTYIDVYPTLGVGIIADMVEFRSEFGGMAYIPTSKTKIKRLDSIYRGRSGYKLLTKTFTMFEETATSFGTRRTEFVAGIIEKYNDKWNRLYDSLVTQTYNPIHNYDMTDTHSRELTTTENNTDTYTANDTTEVEAGTETQNNIYGFNSQQANPSEKGTDSTNTNTVYVGDDKNVRVGNGTESETETTNRKGNIGVTTTQQMLTQEIELRKQTFYDIMFADIDNEICLKVYDLCRFE